MSDKPNPIELQKSLGGMDYPAGRDQIVKHAQSKGASEDILQFLRDLPDREYDGPDAVSKETAAAGND